MSDAPRTIVAEISKNYPTDEEGRPTLSEVFEDVIETNRQRGYDLHSWKFNQTALTHRLIETIVAVFKASEKV